MNVEENRLRTFTDWPTNAAVDAARIAKAGFYYSGRGLEVQCFLCGVKISDWNYGDQAMVRHRLAEPSCPFVQNPTNTCNVPLVPISANNSGLASSSADALQDNNINELQSVNFNRSSKPQKQYKTMSQRLQTFNNWPISSIISPEKLAKAGFYYLQREDMVECVYCGGILQKWELGDDPDKEHIINFPKCDFYMHQDEDDQLGISLIRELGIQTHTAPKKPNHATYEGRLSTFIGWPENLKQTPEMLSSAGFYYDGFGDHVRCFHCDGGLRDWETTDDAWTEHAKWFPKCEFVNLVRGQEFIKQCINSRPPLDPSIFEGVAENDGTDTDITETPPASLPTVLPTTSEITEAALERLLDSPPATAALEVGLHVGRVKRAIKRRMEEVGTPYTNSDQLIEDVLRGQVMEDDTRLQTPDSPSSELTTLLNLVLREQTNNALKQCNNIQRNDNHQENKDKSDLYPYKTENSKLGDDNELDKKANVKSKETASLEEENRRLKEARLCKICMDREVAIVFLPCGHLATCVYCAPTLTYCPMCRQEIRATVRTFLS
ncbi:death-associated inhibitor of apoptosis 2 isoform X2 [Megachile rotundata]|uniref:death-associated inhibitor of apoptosis 2 isoform X2 n=1 Tax=Megachile rotundata TaxID=143995 RepID=UPI000258F870|nr:PREDICTED: baculoviral IAP repeat-containing protein 7 [Megachile rotundata]